MWNRIWPIWSKVPNNCKTFKDATKHFEKGKCAPKQRSNKVHDKDATKCCNKVAVKHLEQCQWYPQYQFFQSNPINWCIGFSIPCEHGTLCNEINIWTFIKSWGTNVPNQIFIILEEKYPSLADDEWWVMQHRLHWGLGEDRTFPCLCQPGSKVPHPPNHGRHLQSSSHHSHDTPRHNTLEQTF